MATTRGSWSRAKPSPMQRRGPPEKGKKAIRWRRRAASGANRSGSKPSGLSQNSGWRWVTYGHRAMLAPAGMR
jgi:hypothetical protein